MFRTISWLAIAAIGVSVTVGVLLKDLRVSIAGGAGGLAAAVGLWVLIESLVRGSFWEAVKTSPAEDLRELMAPGSLKAEG